MAAPVHRKRKINLNLLKPQGIPEKIYTRFFKWLVAYGRFIVIFVEIIVMGAFFARFKLDADLISLKEKIGNKLPFVESLGKQEITIRRTQFKLATIKKTYSAIPDWTTTFDHLAENMPSGVRLNSINLNHTASSPSLTFKITGQALSNNDLAILLTSLKKQPGFKDTNLATINFDQGVILFTITGVTE